jgi:hypothetical protein
MAFSESDQARLFDRMGQARRFLSVDSALLQAIAAVGNDAAVSALVVSYLDRCDEIDEKLIDAEDRQALMSADQGDVVFAQYRELVSLRSQGRQYVGRIARLLGVEPRGDCFSASINANVPSWTPLNAMYGGSGSNMKIG